MLKQRGREGEREIGINMDRETDKEKEGERLKKFEPEYKERVI